MTEPDWRTDTVERPALRVREHRRADPSTRVQRAVRIPSPLPGPDVGPPPAARWPLYAELVPGIPAAPVAPRRHPALPWVAAVVALVMTAGATGLAVSAGRDDAPPATTGEELDRSATEDGPADDQDDGADGEAGAGRGDGTSRGGARGEDTADDGTDDGTAEGADDGATDPGAGRRTGGGANRPAARVRAEARSVIAGARASAPTTAAPNEGLSGEPVGYAPSNLVDGRPGTAWRMPGNGRDTVLTVRLDGPTEITSVGLVNGYAKTARSGGETVDWYLRNRRVRQVEWFFDDGTRIVHQLPDSRRMQRTDIAPVTSSTVRVRITRVSPPGPGRTGRDFTAVSEIDVHGVPVD